MFQALNWNGYGDSSYMTFETKFRSGFLSSSGLVIYQDKENSLTFH